MSRKERERLEDILTAIAAIRRYVAGADVLETATLDACYFNFVVIGEAARHLTADLRERAAEIPWARIIGYRNYLAHDYFRVDRATAQQIIRDDLGPLETAVRRLLDE
jgi:uncharacterized protein with HEPN domain